METDLPNGVTIFKFRGEFYYIIPNVKGGNRLRYKLTSIIMESQPAIQREWIEAAMAKINEEEKGGQSCLATR